MLVLRVAQAALHPSKASSRHGSASEARLARPCIRSQVAPETSGTSSIVPDPQAQLTLPKAPTGIAGFDDLTFGGLPAGRPTLICGAAGCGKTLFATTFLVNGATRFGEPGVFMSFEERAEDLAANVASLGYDLDGLVADGQARHRPRARRAQRDRGERRIRPRGPVRPPRLRGRQRRRQAGRARHASRRCSAGFNDPAILRAELRRLFGWLKDRGADRGHHRRARRGPAHPPGPGGVRLRLRDPARQPGRGPDHHAPPAGRQVSRLGARHQRISVPDRRCGHQRPAGHLGRTSTTRSRARSSRPASPGLDAMLGPGGFYRGSSILISGVAGTGKTTLARLVRRCRLPPRRALPVLRLRGERATRSAATSAPSGLDLDAARRRAACCASRRRGPACTGWRCIWRGCTATSSSSGRTSW